jgi:hypothetical protein
MKFYYLALLPAKDNKEFPYSIHGLWSQESVDKWHYCPKGGHKFEIERLRVLLPELHAHWHSSRGTDENFWKHEWEKHGSCTGLKEFEYFQKTLDCFDKVKANGKEWVHQWISFRIPFGLDFQILPNFNQFVGGTKDTDTCPRKNENM